MATQMQVRRGTTAETLTFTGAQGEITVDTDKNALVVHDGVTPGGFYAATSAELADGTFYYNDDIPGGSAADSYILVPKPNTNAPNNYEDGILLGFVTANPNTGPSTATFQGLGVKNIKYPGGVDPAPGDVFGRVTLIFDAGNDWLELQRKPAGDEPQIRTVGATVSGNAMAVSLEPCDIDFRSPSLNSGTILPGFVTSKITLTIPAGATLGTVSGLQSRIAIVAILNSGVVELAVINLSGANSLDETGVISTTAISAASSSSSVFYSAVGRSGVPYRVMGYVQSTQAAAGTWTTPPSQIQGQGGQAIIRGSLIQSGTAQSTSSGTSIDFTGIPAGVKRLTFIMSGVSTNGTSNLLLQIGGASVETSGYNSTASFGTSAATSTTGFLCLTNVAAASTHSGMLVISQVSPGSWVLSGTSGASGTSAAGTVASGNKSITGVLERIRLTSVSGTDTFDAGSVNIFYEA